jgi:hypothetical protein
MCLMPEVSVEQSRFGYGKKYEKARDEAQGGKPYDKRRLDPCGPVKRTTISLPPKYWNMIPEDANRSQWIRSAVLSSASRPLKRTNYERQTFQRIAYSIVTDSSLSPIQKTRCLTSLAEALVDLEPI